MVALTLTLATFVVGCPPLPKLVNDEVSSLAIRV